MLVTRLLDNPSSAPIIIFNIENESKEVVGALYKLLFQKDYDKTNLIGVVNLLSINNNGNWRTSYIKAKRIYKSDQHRHISFYVCDYLDHLGNEVEGVWIGDFDVDKEILMFDSTIYDHNVVLGANRVIQMLSDMHYKGNGYIITDRIQVRHKNPEDELSTYSWFVATRIEGDKRTVALGILAFNSDEHEWLETPLAANFSTHYSLASTSNQVAYATTKRAYDKVNYNGHIALINKTMAYSIPKLIEYIANQQYKHTVTHSIHSQLLPLLSEKAKNRLAAENALKNLDPQEKIIWRERKDQRYQDGILVFD